MDSRIGWTGWKTWSEWTAGLDGKANFFVLHLRLSRSVSFVADLNIVVWKYYRDYWYFDLFCLFCFFPFSLPHIDFVKSVYLDFGISFWIFFFVYGSCGGLNPNLFLFWSPYSLSRRLRRPLIHEIFSWEPWEPWEPSHSWIQENLFSLWEG